MNTLLLTSFDFFMVRKLIFFPINFIGKIPDFAATTFFCSAFDVCFTAA